LLRGIAVVKNNCPWDNIFFGFKDSETHVDYCDSERFLNLMTFDLDISANEACVPTK
jgi:hypothetical protein